jgi:HEAT repeat protein
MKDWKTPPRDRLLDALRHGDLEAKRAGVSDLLRRKSESSAAALVALLESPSWYLREQAVIALSEMGPLAVEPLAQRLDSGLWYTRAAAIRALGRLGSVPHLARFVAMLEDPNGTVQAACLASIADLVRRGHARETARLFWAEGIDRADRYRERLVREHPDAGRQVAEILGDPGSFIQAVPSPEPAATEEKHGVSAEPETRRNA